MANQSPKDPEIMVPQPQFTPPVVKDPVKVMKEELEANKTRLTLTLNLMAEMKNQIEKCTNVLKKELGKYVDIQALVRTGSGSGPLGRTQEIINLRLRLSSLKSQFLDPVHKVYYRGPFDPRQKFDVNIIPKKQDSLYGQLLEEEKKVRLQKQDKPLETVKEEVREISLMYRASCYREKSLKGKIREAKVRLDKIKAETVHRTKVMEYMISHQSLIKAMLNPKNMSLNASLSYNYKSTFSSVKKDMLEFPEQYKFKTFYDKTEKDVKDFQEKLLSLVKMLDSNTEQLVKAEGLCIQTRCGFERLEQSEPPAPVGNKNSSKQKGVEEQKPEEKETSPSVDLALLEDENRIIREFLLSPFVLNEDDFRLFLLTLAMTKTEFLNSIDDIKLSCCSVNKEAF